MPRALKRESTTPKKNDSKNNKRKRSQQDIDDSNSKKIKVSWLRDIKAVLRSAGNRLGYTENELTYQRKRRVKSKRNESKIGDNNRSEESDLIRNLASQENIDLDIDRIDSIDVINNNICKLETDSTNAHSLAPTREVLNDTNREDKEETIEFRQIECKASGTNIRIEKIPQAHKSAEIEKLPIDHKSVESVMSNSLCCDHKVEQLSDETDMIVDDGSSSNAKIIETNLTSMPSTVETELENGGHYYFGNQDIVDTSNTIFTFASPHCQQIKYEKRNAIEINQSENNIEVLDCQIPVASDSNLSVERIKLWVNHCTENGINGLDLNPTGDHAEETIIEFDDITSSFHQCPPPVNEYNHQINAESNNSPLITSESNDSQIINSDANDVSNGDFEPSAPISSDLTRTALKHKRKIQVHANTQVTPAYYDSNRSAFFEPNNLPEEIRTNSFKSTWGSIKNLISRVSGQKGNGESNSGQPDSFTDSSETDPHP